MNIVYIHTHDTGRYIQPYGHAVPTPNLQALAEEGVLFRQAFSAAPTCSPSRTGLLTGMAPHSAGMIGLAQRGFRLNDASRHLASYLASNGYETVLCGVQHEAPEAEVGQLGYTLNLAARNTGAGHAERDLQAARLAADYIRQADDRPFFASVGFFNTHRHRTVFPATGHAVDDRYVLPPFPLYDHPANRTDMADFIASAALVDQGVGIVVEALRESGRWDDTILLFTTDHGIAFPRMKCNLYDTGIGVSLLMHIPGVAKGQVVDALVSQLDLFPTLCELAELERPSWLQGKSLLPLLNGGAAEVRGELFAEVTYHAAYEPMRCIRTPRYKLIRRFGAYDKHVMPNIDDGYGKRFLVEHGIRERRRSQEELFDLFLDPVERENLIGDPAYAAIEAELKAKLLAWMAETGDPLLETDEVPLPEGARTNGVDELNPT
ncbi:sulfatase family protein [Paenibacillus sacheonensis]|uniref:Sulfatase-like hydrolase/transferase n=1 Tax=Paenibacillus sacheonensis TaxID=742054 RepID=A0A7X5C464_9BACL|nr:sulfatase [Paenibacillus sacheonensis]MBM7569179.1 arylsulfatase A-like enzyme [Paenibacillus sacheonensis]NBC73005.1 sulfatase-like hydrolase/transferase [Paenibacillus sacheonensis]